MADPKIITLMRELWALTGGYVNLSCHADPVSKKLYYALYNRGIDHFYCTTHRQLIAELGRRIEFYTGRKGESA